MSIVTDCKFIKEHLIKNKYVNDYFDGFIITTSDDTNEDTPKSLTTIFPKEYTKITNFCVLISSIEYCCKNRCNKCDIIMPKMENFVGSTILKIAFGDTKEYKLIDDTYADKCIIDVATDRGLFKFIIYSSGCQYAHEVYVSFNDYVHYESFRW